MKNRDFIALKRGEILNKMNAAVAANDAEAFTELFLELCQDIEQNVLEEAKDDEPERCKRACTERCSSAYKRRKRILRKNY